MVGLSHMGRSRQAPCPTQAIVTGRRDLGVTRIDKALRIFTAENADSAARHSRNQSSETEWPQKHKKPQKQARLSARSA